MELIPQRPPIVMVDMLAVDTDEDCKDGTGIIAGLYVSGNNIFVESGTFMEPGIIEHMAQSAAAFSGYMSVHKGTPPSIGFLAEVKRFHLKRLPEAGQRLRTVLKVIGEAGGMSLMELSTCLDDGGSPFPGQQAASCQMKIFSGEKTVL